MTIKNTLLDYDNVLIVYEQQTGLIDEPTDKRPPATIELRDPHPLGGAAGYRRGPYKTDRPMYTYVYVPD